MPVPLSLMREQLLPGLMEVAYGYRRLPHQWDHLFNPTPLPPIMISPGAAVALAAAAVVVKNPELTRRNLFGLR